MYNIKKFYLPLAISLVLISIFTCFRPYYEDASLSSYTSSINDSEELTFYVASDIHYLSKELTDYGEAFNKFKSSGDGKQIDYITEIFDTFSEEVISNKPDFLVISGDLTLNGEKKSHEEISSKLRNIKDSGIPIYVIPGNHDINNPWAREFNNEKQIKTDYISKDDFLNFYNDFGYKDAISRDKYSLSYLAAPSNKIWLLMIDDNNYNNNISLKYPESNGFISKNTLNWINSCGKLAKEKGAKIIAVSHHNVINHSDYIYSGFTIDNNEDVIKCFESCNINLSLSGHIHFQSIKNYKNNSYTLSEIASSSLANYPQKYGVIKISKDNCLSYKTNKLDMSKFRSDFSEYSKNSYKDFIYNQNFNKLSYTDTYTADELKSMCETICNIRLKYDDTLDELSWSDIVSCNGFYLLKSCTSPYIKHYLKIASDGNEMENNTYYMNL